MALAAENLAAQSGGSSVISHPIQAYVYCVPLPEGSGVVREGYVMWGGKFDLQQVPPGAYRVLAFDRQQMELEYQSVEAMRTYDTKGQIVRLVAGQRENLSLQLILTSE